MSDRQWQRTASVSLLACALAWIGWLLIDDWNGLRGALLETDVAGLVPLLLLGVLANCQHGIVFHWQLRHIERQPVSFKLFDTFRDGSGITFTRQACLIALFRNRC